VRIRGFRSDLIDPTIATHPGRVVKRTDDGVLIEFRHAVDAVRYAIEVQTEFYRAQRQRPAADRRIEFTSAFIWATSSRRPWLAENASS
jgi:adenylate cyclase